MNVLQDVADVFSGFHDGVITGFEGDYEKLILIMECQYIAEKVNPNYERFYIELLSVEKLEFDTWRSTEKHPEKILSDLRQIFQTELEIMTGKVDDDHVFILCRVDDIDYGYTGGIIRMNCNGIKIHDQGGDELSLGSFHEIVSGYWESARNRRNG